MAKRRKKTRRRKLFGAALHAWKKKRGLLGGKRRKSRKVSRRRRRNAPWNKGKKLRHYKGISGYTRRPSVKRHRRRVNPMKFRLPAIPTMRGMMGDVQRGLIAGGVLLGTFIGASYISKQLERIIPGAGVGVPNFLLKFGTALGTVYVARMVVRQPSLQNVALGGAFLPLALEGVGMILPGLAAQVPVIGAAAIPAAPAPAASGGMLSMPPGPRLSDYTIDAELEAELEQETESGMF